MCERSVKWFVAVGAVILAAGLFLVAPGTAQAEPKGKVVVASYTSFECTGGDPHTATGANAKAVKAILHDGLTVKRPDGNLHPAIAKSWVIAEDWSKIELTLNEKAKFHDGTPVTAEDVKFSIERAMRPELKFVFGGELRRLVDRVEIVDDHNVVVYLKGAYPAFLGRSAEYLAIVPKHYIEKVGDAEFAQKPIGAGAYKFVAMKQDDFIEAEAVADHYRQPPAVKTLVFKIVPEETTRLAMLTTGEADIVQVPPSHVRQVEADPNLRIQWSKYTYIRTLMFYDLAFPDDPSPWSDIRVRKAASYAINRKAICEKILYGGAEPWGDVLAPYHAGFDPNIEPYPYDPEKAKALLKEAGYPDGFDTILTANPSAKLPAQAVQANLKKVGIRAELNIPEHAMWSRMMHQRKYRGIGFQPGPWWSGRSHPAVALQSHLASKTGWTYYSPPELLEAMDKLMIVVGDEKITAQAKEVSRIYHEQMPRFNLWAKHTAYGLGPRVEYWENVPGWNYTGNLDLIRLKD